MMLLSLGVEGTTLSGVVVIAVGIIIASVVIFTVFKMRGKKK